MEVIIFGLEIRSSFFKKIFEEMVLKVKSLRFGFRVVFLVEEEELKKLVVEGGVNEEVGENNTDVEDLFLIRN